MDSVATARARPIETLRGVLGANRNEPSARGARRRCPGARDERGHHAGEFGQLPERAQGLHGRGPDGGSQQLRESRMLALRRVLARRHLAGHGRGVEQRVREGHARRPVQRRVMDLGVERELARRETLDHVQAPERAVALEQPRVQPGDRRFQLREAARRRQPHVTHVRAEIDGVGVDPDRIGDRERHAAPGGA